MIKIIYVILLYTILIINAYSGEIYNLAPKSILQSEDPSYLVNAPEANQVISEMLETLDQRWDIFSKEYVRITGWKLPPNFQSQWKNHIKAFHISFVRDTKILFQLNHSDLFCTMNQLFFHFLDHKGKISVFSHELGHVINNLVTRNRFFNILSSIILPYQAQRKEEIMADRVGHMMALLCGVSSESYVKTFEATDAFVKQNGDRFLMESIAKEKEVHPPTSERAALARAESALFQKSL